MDRFFQNLRVGGSIQRFNFAIDDSDELFHPHSHHNLTIDQVGKDPALSDLHLRVERQVLQRLPKTRALLFTIRTYITPIMTVTEDLEVARGLNTSVNSYSNDVALYKNKPLWGNILDEHLKEVLTQS
jgi:dimethylamine monooxygenase subunit A